MKNIELKVSLRDFGQIIPYLKKISAKHIKKMRQVDTYFKCKAGRLKLREINSDELQLIFYNRPNRHSSKLSDYYILSFKKDQAEVVKLILSKLSKIENIVKKERNLWIYKHTRIHLDDVSNLGKFLELETVIRDISISQAKKEHSNVIKFLKLSKFKRYDKSYNDLVNKNL